MPEPHTILRAGGYGRPPVPQTRPGPHRARSFAWFLLALLFALFCERVAPRLASVITMGVFGPLVSSLIFLLLLLVGFSAMAAIGQLQGRPLTRMGLVRRAGAHQEWGLGALLGWGGVVACLLPVALVGGLIVTLNQSGFVYALSALVADTLTLLVATLAAELIFRGYPFQRLMDTTGVTLATILMSILFAVDRLGAAPLTFTNFLTAFLLGLVLANAWLRTRALWVGWGLHFAWSATTAILFGLPVAGQTQFSPIFSTYSESPAWLAGGGAGPEGSLWAAVVLIGLLIVLARSTRELRHRWAYPEPVAGGYPVDVDALSRAQHASGMGPTHPEPAADPLVQIAPVTPQDRDAGK